MHNRTHRLFFFIGAIFTAVLTLDRIGKAYAQHMWQFEPVGWSWLQLVYFKNEYIAFSIPFSGVMLEVVIGVILLAIAWFLWRAVQKHSTRTVVGLTLVLAGGLSNFYDRLTYGFIIDYVHIGRFPIFNGADVAIAGGTALLIYLAWRDTLHNS